MKIVACGLLFGAALALHVQAEQNSALSPEAERRGFTLPPGYKIELVAGEEQGVGKPITVAWDDSGRLWTITALEYPLDGNENPREAAELYKRGGRDRVMVFDDPYGSLPSTPRVFADNLAMPMGVLPYKNGAFVGHGPEVLYLSDTDGDGKADKKEVILSGFGIQDSHLMPHQFTRAPGGWFYLAQGAFNYSRVKTTDGREHPFDQTRLARFTPDGANFEALTSGPCNIWGLVIDREGETFIQEANDFGYPVMLYQEGGSYPGCTGLFKPYAPYFPSEVEFRMGGTGLSGLALSDPKGSFPGAFADLMFVANPITRKIQAIKIHREGPRFRYELKGDFLTSTDEWFRPVSIHFGPDGALYVVDFYNKIISHNEVPRNHPDRDKSHGRIWRVSHESQAASGISDIARAPDHELLKYLGSDSTWQARAAWHQIADRNARQLAPELRQRIANKQLSAAERIVSLWAMEDLSLLDTEIVRSLLSEENRNLRREAIRSLRHPGLGFKEIAGLLQQAANDKDPEVRAEVIRCAGGQVSDDPHAIALLLQMAGPSLPQPMGKSPHNGAPMKLREAYDRDFERYLVRAALEAAPEATAQFLAGGQAGKVSEEGLILAMLAAPNTPATFPETLGKLRRAPSEEELLKLAQMPPNPKADQALRNLLEKNEHRQAVMDQLVTLRLRLDPTRLTNLLEEPVRALFTQGEAQKISAINAVSAFKLAAFDRELNAELRAVTKSDEQIRVLKALRELHAGDPDTLAAFAINSDSAQVRSEAVQTLASNRSPDAPGRVLDFWPRLTAPQKRFALGQITSTPEGARKVFEALKARRIPVEDLDGSILEKIQAHLENDAAAKALLAEMAGTFRSVLRLDGTNASYLDSNITLAGPFTVETWVWLDQGVSNADGILGRPGGADFNFAGGLFRVWCGQAVGDRLIATKPITPGAWTHYAVTRDDQGVLRLYINGELNCTDNRAVTNNFDELDIGRTTPNEGTSGAFLEFRVWNRARTAEEIRSSFDLSFEGEETPEGLVFLFPSNRAHAKLQGGARLEKIADAPALLKPDDAKKLAANFERARSLARAGGNPGHGRELFELTCATCHTVAGKGGQVGPVLDGAGAMGDEALLRAILTPNAAMEAGYRTFRVETVDGEIIDGFMVARDDTGIVLRRPNSADQKLPVKDIRIARFTNKSLMPEGLLDGMRDGDAADLFAYLKTLK